MGVRYGNPYEGLLVPEEICGKCKYHRKDDYNNPLAGWVCQNLASYYEGEETEYNDTCSEFTPRRTY